MTSTSLHYVSTDQPGFRRKKWGRGFTYLDCRGETIQDANLRGWFESIVIPPAWTDVWISPRKNSHILATGRDAKGRKQYRYHPLWQKLRNQKKFNRLYDFGVHLPKIRQVTDRHLRSPKLSRERVLAAIIRLLENSLIRIGNVEYAEKNGSYGLTTLQVDHAEVNGSKIIFDFVGKSGKEHTIVLQNRRLARVVKRCQDLPGYELFQYFDENGDHQVVDSADVNAYLSEITHESFTAKVFRTWGASTLAIRYLCREGGEEEGDIARLNCVAHVATLLGNTRAVCRKYYIHPLIFEAHENGVLFDAYQNFATDKRVPNGLYPEEKTLIKLIDQTGTTPP